MTEVPEHLLQRSRERRRAMGQEVDDGPAPTATAAAPSAAPVAAAAPAAKAPVPFPAAAPPAPVAPDSDWVRAAKERAKIPYWVMPVLVFLPVWLIMYVATLEDPTRSEGVIYEGGKVYEAQCASCHGAGGGGGVGPAFTNGAIIDTFADAEAHVAWVVQGTQNFEDAGRATYGDNETAVGATGALMPAFGVKLTAEEIIAAVFYERIELGGHESELELAEAIWYKLGHGELDGGFHFAEGQEGDFNGKGEVAEFFDESRAEVSGEEVASEG